MAVNFLTLRSAVANDMAVHNMTYSTLTGSTILVQNKYYSTLMGSTIAVQNMSYSTLIGSTISVQTMTYSTLIGSTIAVQNMSYSTLRGSTIMVSALNISPTTAHSGIVLNVVGSTMISGNVSILGGVTGSEVYTNGWFRVNGGGGVYWQTYGRGIYSADSAGASYGNVSVYGTGINSWNGYDINGRYTFMANGDTVGVHDRNHSWVWYNVNGTMYINKRLIVNGTSIEDRLAALEAKVFSIMPLDGYIRAGPDYYISIRGMGGQALRYVNISAAAVAAGSFYAYGYRDI